MDLYFSPLACSMATRVALYEAGAEANYLEVDPPTKKVLSDGSDFRTVNPIGLVPTLRTDDGMVLTENAAILQYVADRFPQSGLGATQGIDRTRLHQWLCFIGTELHKGLFVPVLDRKAPQEAKAYVLEKNLSRLDYLDKYLEGREFLLDHFSVADDLSRHGHQLDHGDTADQARQMAECEGLLRAPAPAAVNRTRDRGGVRAVQGRAGAEEGGGVGRNRT